MTVFHECATQWRKREREKQETVRCCSIGTTLTFGVRCCWFHCFIYVPNSWDENHYCANLLLSSFLSSNMIIFRFNFNFLFSSNQNKPLVLSSTVNYNKSNRKSKFIHHLHAYMFELMFSGQRCLIPPPSKFTNALTCDLWDFKNQPVLLGRRQLIDLEKVQWSMTTERTKNRFSRNKCRTISKKRSEEVELTHLQLCHRLAVTYDRWKNTK